MLTETRGLLSLATACLLSAAVVGAAQGVPAPAVAAVDAVIPQPSQSKAGQGAFVLAADTSVIGCGAAAATAAQLASALHLPTGTGKGRAIVLEIVPGAPKDGYTLSLTPERIRIQAADSAGLFYGAQSLRQLVVAARGAPLPAVEIADAPRFAWRGLLVDVANHFFPRSALM
ncbi:MAG: beta-N-acetylhexosaminidase, partial [Pseudomonadota bacterium]|nr:beta-N-acetylhexosaminidase [Pseudomonadota bacterium]